MSSSSKHGAPPINIRGKNSQEIQYYDMIANRELMSPSRSRGRAKGLRERSSQAAQDAARSRSSRQGCDRCDRYDRVHRPTSAAGASASRSRRGSSARGVSPRAASKASRRGAGGTKKMGTRSSPSPQKEEDKTQHSP